MSRPRQMGIGSLVGALSILCFPELALAQDPPTPKLAIAQTTIRMDVRKGGFFDTRSTTGDAKGLVIVSNQGTAATEGIHVTGHYLDGAEVPVEFEQVGTNALGVPVDLAPNESVAIKLTFDWTRTGSESGWFVITSSSGGGGPITVPFQIRELIPGAVLGRVFVWSAVVASLIVFLLWLSLGRRDHKITVGSTWTFKDAWASNLTATGAVLGTVLAASGFLSDVLPGLSTGMFVGFSLLYGFLVLLAPLLFTMAYKKGKPTYWGLLLAAVFVLWAVIGELGTAVQLVNRGGAPPTAGWLALAGIVVFLFFYTRTSVLNVIQPAPPAAIDTVPAATAAAASAAADTIQAGGSVEQAVSAAEDAARAVIDAAAAAEPEMQAELAPPVESRSGGMI